MGILDWDIGEVEMGRRDDNKMFSWQKLNLDRYVVDKPTVFCLSGNGTITSKDANGLCKHAEVYLDLIKENKDDDIKDKVDIIGFKYAKTSPGSEIGKLTPEFVEKFNNRVLVPLFKDKSGKRLDLNTAMKNMSKITFFSYCVGAREINDIMETLNFKLGKLGYSDSEIILINNAGKHISFAPYDTSRSYLPTVRFVSTEDRMVGSDVHEILKDQGLSDFEGIMVSKDQPKEIYGKHAEYVKCGGVNVISSKLLNAFEERGDEHFINIINRDEDWNVRPFKRGIRKLSSDNADCVSQMMAWALCRGVENSLENEEADVFVPSNFNTDLMDELVSIKDAFGQSRLGMSEEHKSRYRRKDYKRDSYEYSNWVRTKNAKSTYCEPKANIYTQLSRAEDFEEIAYIFEKNNYYYIDEFLPILKLSKDEITALKCAEEERKKTQAILKWKNNQYGLVQKLKLAKSMEDIEALLPALDRKSAKVNLLSVVDGAPSEHPLTYEKSLEVLGKLEKKWALEDSENSASYWNFMINKFEDIESSKGDKFQKTAELLERKNYFAVTDIMSQCGYLSDTQKNIIKSMDKAKKQAQEFEKSRTHIPSFDEVKWEASNASSVEEVMDVFAKYNYFGVEYILPEIVVLTEEEKEEILHRCGEFREEMNRVM